MKIENRMLIECNPSREVECQIKRIVFRSYITVSIFCGLEMRGPRENSEKLRLMRPVCLGDDVRDIESLGGSPPSILSSHSRSPLLDLRLAHVYPRPPSDPFLRLLRTGDADRGSNRAASPLARSDSRHVITRWLGNRTTPGENGRAATGDDPMNGWRGRKI